MNQPKPISGLAAVAANLSWSWNRNARALFRMLDPALWRRTQHNPIELLRRVDPPPPAPRAAGPGVPSLFDAAVGAAAPDATAPRPPFAPPHPPLVQHPIPALCAPLRA